MARKPLVNNTCDCGRGFPKDSHFAGKRTGYHLVNGEYHLAPSHKQAMEEIIGDRAGVEELLQAVNAFAANRLADLAKRHSRWWDYVCEDLSLDRKKAWGYINGAIVDSTSSKEER